MRLNERDIQTLEGEVRAAGQDRQAGCHFHITAPPNQRVEIVVNSIDGSCTDDCLLGAVEIKYDDLTKGGARCALSYLHLELFEFCWICL